MGIQDTDVGIVSFAHEKVTVAAAVTILTSATYLNAIYAEMTVETAEMRIRYDGSDPSDTVGHLIGVGDVITLEGTTQIAHFKAHRTTGTSGVLMVSYFR